LLIGVTAFLNPAVKVKGLNGPSNDVELFKQVLMHPLGVPEANIRTLVDPPTDPTKRRPDDEMRRPTRANIEREFAALANAKPNNDQIVIFMAGHGSQQPANADPAGDDPELDGLDEIFLPADIGPWDGTRGVVANAIVDDDIRRWVTAIRNTGASVWIIFDSCHSGTMTRGVGDDIERERQVSMAELGIPTVAVETARARATRGATGRAGKTWLGLSDGAGEIAALYAADSDEKTIERRFDPGPNVPTLGLFTYHLAKVLREVTTPLTYRELAGRVLDQYRAQQRFASTPTFEGGGLDREVLGHRTWPDRPPFSLSRTETGAWTIDAGNLLGVRTGSILEIYPPAGTAKAQVAVGHVKVTSAQSLSAIVEPVAFAKRPAPPATAFVPSSRARVVYYAPAELRLEVAVQQEVARTRSTGDSEYAIVRRGTGPVSLERALGDLLSRTDGLVERVETPDADWFVRLIGGDVVLVPAAGWQPDTAPMLACVEPPPPPPAARPGDYCLRPAPGSTRVRHFRIGPVASPRTGDALTETLDTIARAANLSRLATSPGTGPAVDFTVTRVDRETGGTPRPLLSPPWKDAIVTDGEWLEYRIVNRGAAPVDVTLLYVDASFAIVSVFPRRDPNTGQDAETIDRRIGPNQTVSFREYVCGCPLGWESTVMIAVEVDPANPRRQSFSRLEQRGVRTRGPGMSSLSELLDRIGFGRGPQTRDAGDPPADLDRFVVKVAAWRTEAKR
jgi:hypothetical protein